MVSRSKVEKTLLKLKIKQTETTAVNSGSGPSIPRKPGRPKGVRTGDPVFDTQKQASKFYGIPASVIQLAKSAGAPGVKYGRIDGAVFGPWFKDWLAERDVSNSISGAKTKEDWQLLILSEKHADIRRKNMEADGLLIERAEAIGEMKRQIQNAGQQLIGLGERMALDCAGQPPHEIERIVNAAAKVILEKLRASKLNEEWKCDCGKVILRV